MTQANTLFLRLEGPLQAWGNPSKFVIRRTMDAPTKSGVLGILCCAMGLSRQAARERLPELNRLAMGVRIDRAGTRWWDYQTVGAKMGMVTARSGLKTGAQGTLVTRREYLSDASFLIALQGDSTLIQQSVAALAMPRWPIFLGRKSCQPSIPVFSRRHNELWSNPTCHDSLDAALSSIAWSPRYKADPKPENNELETLMEWRPVSEEDIAPDNAEVWYDVPVSFDPPVHMPRFIMRGTLSTEIGEPLQGPALAVPRPNADYTNSEYRKRREERIKADAGVCVFCKSPGPRMTVQHVTYRRAGGNETMDDLRSLCGLCHDAVTMIEYGLSLGIDRINPEEPQWRDRIIRKREEIIKFRSLEIRRRRLAAEEV